jgi:TPR repeat protein
MHAVELLNKSDKIKIRHLLNEAASEHLIARRARAKFDIADLYMTRSESFSGKKREKLKEIAVFWLNASAEDYNSKAVHALARLFLHGDTVSPCLVLAIKLSLAAVELGNKRAQITLDMATEAIKRSYHGKTLVALNLIH